MELQEQIRKSGSPRAYLGIYELRESVQTIFGESEAAATRAPSVGVARLRKLCAAAVLGLALFAFSSSAYADDAQPGSGASTAAMPTDIDAASAAAVAQASAIVGAASADASQAVTEATAPPASSDANGSTSGPSGGISSEPTVQPEQSATPTIDGAAASAVEGAATTAAAVVAATKQVVSQPQAPAAGAGVSPTPNTAPSAGAAGAGKQYQQNDGRYQPDNSGPISSEIGTNAPGEPSAESPTVGGRTSSGKSGRIPLPKCLQDLPDSVLQTECDNALSQLPDVSSVLVSPPSKKSTGHPRKQRSPRTSSASRPALPSPAIPSAQQIASAARAATAVVTVPTSKHTAPATRHERPAAVRTHRRQPIQIVKQPEPSIVTSRPETVVREAAASERSRAPASARRPLFVVALLLGLASLAVALASLRVRHGVALTALTTRLRSKGLSSLSRPRPRAAEDVPPAIRYRE